MTYEQALKAAEYCLERVKNSPGYDISDVLALRLQALAEAAKGYIMLAQELRK